MLGKLDIESNLYVHTHFVMYLFAVIIDIIRMF